MKRTRLWSLVTLTVIALSPTLGGAQMTSQIPRLGSDRTLSQGQLNSVLQGKPMNLEYALRVAMMACRPLGDAIARFHKARAAVGEVNSAYLPQISLGTQATEFDKPNSIDLGALMGGPSLPLTIANRWNPSIGAGLTMQIDISGAVRAASSQSEFMALAARIEIDRVRNQVGFDVRSTYYQLVRAHGQRQVAEENLNVARTKLHDAIVNAGAGSAPKFDVVSAQRDLAEAEQGVVVSASRESIALSLLKNAIGVDQSVDFPVTTESELNTPTMSDTMEPVPKTFSSSLVQDATIYGPSYDRMIAEAQKARPEILESLAVIEAAKHGVQYAKRTMLPTLAAGLSYSYQPNNGAFTLERSTAATLSLNIPVFDGGLAHSRIREAEADRSSAQSSYRGAVDQVKLEVQNAYVSLLQAQARIRMADAGLVQAREAYRLAKERYVVGVSQSSVVSPQLELSSAQAALTLAQSNRVDAVADFRIAQAGLDHAIGRFSRPAAESKL